MNVKISLYFWLAREHMCFSSCRCDQGSPPQEGEFAAGKYEYRITRIAYLGVSRPLFLQLLDKASDTGNRLGYGIQQDILDSDGSNISINSWDLSILPLLQMNCKRLQLPLLHRGRMCLRKIYHTLTNYGETRKSWTILAHGRRTN